MNFSSSKRELLQVYLLSVLLMFACFLFLQASPQGRLSLELPDQGVSQHPWNGSDVMSYVEPAQNYLETGTFSRQGEPDMHRTIGYPAFLAIAIHLCGKYWMICAYIMQIALFGLLYPANSVLLKYWFPACASKQFNVALVLLFLGVGTAYTGFLLSDQLFTSLLYAGIASGVLAVKRCSWRYALLHVIFIGCAAQIRPTLGLFFISDLAFLLYTQKKLAVQISGKLIRIIAFVGIIVFFLGNAPAFRNLVHHDTFTPTSILSDNLARYLAGPVMIAKGRGEEYAEHLNRFKEAKGVQKIEMQKEFAFDVIKEYPVETGKRIVYHVVWNMFEPHWEYLLTAYNSGFGFNELISPDGGLNSAVWKGTPFWLLHGGIIFLALCYVLHCLKNGGWLFVGGLAFFMLPLAASAINGQGARMRLYADPLLIDMAAVVVMTVGVQLGWIEDESMV